MLQLLNSFWPEIVKYGSIALGLILFWFKAKQSGKDTVERKDAMETLKAVRTREKIEDVVTRATDRDKLLEKYMRD